METKLQSESYPRENYSMRTFDEDSSSTWSDSYEDEALNEHVYSSVLRPDNGYSGYDRDRFKRTMLEHEATFGKQVRELHHLYRTQTDMMDGHKRKELYELPLQNGTSQSYFFSSPMASENKSTEKIWHIPHLSVTDDIKPSLDFLKESRTQFSQTPPKSGDSLKVDEMSESKPRRVFDLQLPAHVYIDDDDSNTVEKESIYDVKYERDVKLTLGTNDDFEVRNGLSTQSRPYLNDSRIGLSCEEETGSVWDHSLYGRIEHEETHGLQFPMRSNRSFVTRDFFADEHRDEGACSNYYNADKGETGQEWPAFNYENNGQQNRMNSSNSNINSGFPISSRPLKLKARRAPYNHGHTHTHTHTHTWLEEKPNCDFGPYQQNSPYSDPNYSLLSNSQIIPYSESAPVVLPRRKKRKVTYVPIAIQALPCFPASELLNSRPRKMKKLTQKSAIAHDPNLELNHGNAISVLENSEGRTSQKFSKSPNDMKEKDLQLSLNQSLGDFLSTSRVKKSRKRKNKTSESSSSKKNLGIPSTEELPQNATSIHSEDMVLHEINLETLSRFAAENLVAISLNLTHHIHGDSFDSLHWFADLISSKSVADDDENGVDLFEASTLKLEEVNPNEYLLPPQGLETQKNDKGTCMTSLFLTKARKGQARKKQQQKDFQKDVLPGLVSLSKHEVSEDLQAFNCIMRAMEEGWENNNVLRHDERRVMGWGRTTRRGRRPRVRASNAPSFVSPNEGGASTQIHIM